MLQIYRLYCTHNTGIEAAEQTLFELKLASLKQSGKKTQPKKTPELFQQNENSSG